VKPCDGLTRVAKLEDLVERDRDHDCAGYGPHKICVKVMAVANLPSRFGQFRVVAFWNNRDGKEHIALVRGDVIGAEKVPTRLHSECLTGDALGSLRCDCREQLEAALMRVGALERGIILYLRQEGRGIGLINKIRAYTLQEQGLDTVEANLALGFRDDERDYAVAAHMLASLGAASISLMTNNPTKIRQLQQYGVEVAERIPHVIPPNEHNRFYLETKAERSGHYMTFDRKPPVSEQDDDLVIESPSPL
jgi:GTP cyclohydrolase II